MLYVSNQYIRFLRSTEIVALIQLKLYKETNELKISYNFLIFIVWLYLYIFDVVWNASRIFILSGLYFVRSRSTRSSLSASICKFDKLYFDFENLGQAHIQLPGIYCCIMYLDQGSRFAHLWLLKSIWCHSIRNSY